MIIVWYSNRKRMGPEIFVRLKLKRCALNLLREVSAYSYRGSTVSVIDVHLCYFLSKYFQICGAFVNLTYIIKYTVFLNKSIKNSKDTQQLLISHCICN